MLRTKKLDLIKSSYRLAALIIIISININTLSAQTAGVVREKGGPKGKGTRIGTTSTTPLQNKAVNTNNNKGKTSIPSIELKKIMESMQAEEAIEVAKTHYIGEKYGGGIVFHVTDNGLHGLIAETQDQCFCHWGDAKRISSNSVNYSKEGLKFTDWRLPTINELNFLFLKKDLVGGFTDEIYWSSTESDRFTVRTRSFEGLRPSQTIKSGQYASDKAEELHVRAIRSF
jgi:hypothetical protein